MEQAMFASPAQAINFLTQLIFQMVTITGWMLLWLAHLTVAMLALCVLWATNTTPAEIAHALHAAMQTTPAQMLSAIGFSALMLASGYVWIAKRIHRYTTREWLLNWLTKHS